MREDVSIRRVLDSELLTLASTGYYSLQKLGVKVWSVVKKGFLVLLTIVILMFCWFFWFGLNKQLTSKSYLVLIV